jgi:hypothetical protein
MFSLRKFVQILHVSIHVHLIISQLILDYARAEQVLQPQPYPENYPKLDKLEVLEEQAKLLGKEYHERFYRVPQTTTFQDGLNSMGVKQSHSTLTGQDCTGVNDGSKNSTLMNYLPDAWNRGAEMYHPNDRMLIQVL